MSDPIRWDVSMTQDGIGRFVSYHDYAMKDEQCEALRARIAELEAERATREAVADGFVMVPKKPTREMTMAARANWSGYEEESGRDYDPMWYEVRDVWDAMLAASRPKEKGQ